MLPLGGANVGKCTSGALCPSGNGLLYTFPVPSSLTPLPFGLEGPVLFPDPFGLPVCPVDGGLLLLSPVRLGLPGINFAFSLSAYFMSRSYRCRARIYYAYISRGAFAEGL